MSNYIRRKESGAVSIFSVVFGILIITVITVSFLRVVVSDQRQSTNAALADNARSSALVGVEDAKRALVRYKNSCLSGAGTTLGINCASMKADLSDAPCNVALRGLYDFSGDLSGEVPVRTHLGAGNTMDQAYTCVKVKVDTPDYIGKSEAHQVSFIPLKSVGMFNSINIRWFSRDDVSDGVVSVPSYALSSSSEGGALSSPALIKPGGWSSNTPPVLRAQLVQYSASEGFTLGQFDDRGAGARNFATTFLYPGSLSNTSFNINMSMARCETTIPAGGYSCSARLSLPLAMDSSNEGDRVAYLALMPYYNSAHFSVTLHPDSSNRIVNFDSVQPEIDSTGRASNVFKRLSARVEMVGGGASYPAAAVDLSGDFCKDFSVTNQSFVPGECSR